MQEQYKKEYTTKEFIRLYINDHNGGILRWLRGIFIDEPEKIATILEYMENMEAKLHSQKEEMIKMVEERLKDIEMAIKWANNPLDNGGYSKSWLNGYEKAYEQIKKDLEYIITKLNTKE